MLHNIYVTICVLVLVLTCAIDCKDNRFQSIEVDQRSSRVGDVYTNGENQAKIHWANLRRVILSKFKLMTLITQDQIYRRNENLGVRSYAHGSICKPKVETIKIEDEGNYEFLPGCIDVKRCSGHCTATKLCAPTTSHVEVMTFGKLNVHTNDVTIVEKQIVVHDACEKECRQKAADCTPLQEYYESTCRCWCKDVMECLSGRRFDTNSCQCDCIPADREACTSPKMYYDNSDCKCKRI